MPDDPAMVLDEFRKRLEATRGVVIRSEYADAVRQQVLAFVDGGQSLFISAPYTLA
ncbi:MAG TPA: hypothetical protein VIS31_00965 [Woeseiaceae bacterium]